MYKSSPLLSRYVILLTIRRLFGPPFFLLRVGTKQSSILVSEARKTESINIARGEAEAALVRADATAQALLTVGRAIQGEDGAGKGAVELRVAEKWIEAFSKIAKEGNTLIIPQEASNPSAIIAQALGIFKGVSKTDGNASPSYGTKATASTTHASLP
jgi:hypothetical protein